MLRTRRGKSHHFLGIQLGLCGHKGEWRMGRQMGSRITPTNDDAFLMTLGLSIIGCGVGFATGFMLAVLRAPRIVRFAPVR
jgi:ABC-type amino acid transport system permease subunit